MRPQTYVCVSPSHGLQANWTLNYHLRCAVRCCLQHDTRSHDHREDKHRPATPQSLTNKQRDNCSKKAAQIVDTSHEALHSWRWMIEVLDEILTDDDATKDTFAWS
jgi:hypothetical protein